MTNCDESPYGLRAEHQISGVLDLHKTPVVRLSEDVAHRTALLGIAIERWAGSIGSGHSHIAVISRIVSSGMIVAKAGGRCTALMVIEPPPDAPERT